MTFPPSASPQLHITREVSTSSKEKERDCGKEEREKISKISKGAVFR